MDPAIERRVREEAEYIVANGATVRQTARVLGVSKSTVHKDMESRLPKISVAMAREVCAVFGRNKAQRHLRGGEATRRRYERLRAEAANRREMSAK